MTIREHESKCIQIKIWHYCSLDHSVNIAKSYLVTSKTEQKRIGPCTKIIARSLELKEPFDMNHSISVSH